MKRLVLLFIIFITISGLAAGQSTDEQKLLFAYSQHEIIAILLEEGNYGQILPEFRKILKLELRDDREDMVVRSAWQIVEALKEAKQYSLAHEITDATLQGSQQAENQFSLLMLKAKLLQEEGRRSEALQLYRKAQELQEVQ
jgi:tetratricopeptide (TPR) repeat protein